MWARQMCVIEIAYRGEQKNVFHQVSGLWKSKWTIDFGSCGETVVPKCLASYFTNGFFFRLKIHESVIKRSETGYLGMFERISNGVWVICRWRDVELSVIVFAQRNHGESSPEVPRSH